MTVTMPRWKVSFYGRPGQALFWALVILAGSLVLGFQGGGARWWWPFESGHPSSAVHWWWPFESGRSTIAAVGHSNLDTPHLGAAFEKETLFGSSRSLPYFGFSAAGGLLVSSVSLEGPAARVGLKQGDVITAVNGQPVIVVNGPLYLQSSALPGRDVRLSFIRDGHEQVVDMAPPGRVLAPVESR